MTTQIYRAYDVTTDTLVTLEHAPNAWTSWNVITWGPGHTGTQRYDSLSDAANAVVDLTDCFEDVDAPDPEQVLTEIVDHFGEPDKIYIMSEEPDGGGIFLVNDYECDA